MTPPDAATILLVDDDIRSVRLLARLLRDDGFVVEVATDGESAMARLACGPPPEFLVTDLSMPGAGGIVVARRARELHPDLCVIFVTAYPELIARMSEHRERVFGKPLDYETLAAALHTRRFASRRESQRRLRHD